LIKEFKDFITKGNLVEIAVAFVMGAAFATVVSTFTNRIVSPLIAMIFSVPDLSGTMTFGDIDPATGVEAGSVGAFVSVVLNFLIVAFVMFLVVKAYNRMKAAPAPEEPVTDPEDILLLRQIRDSLNK
jgi:large conductance mechanosensitive channel